MYTTLYSLSSLAVLPRRRMRNPLSPTLVVSKIPSEPSTRSAGEGEEEATDNTQAVLDPRIWRECVYLYAVRRRSKGRADDEEEEEEEEEEELERTCSWHTFMRAPE